MVPNALVSERFSRWVVRRIHRRCLEDRRKEAMGWYERRLKLLPLALLWGILYTCMLILWKVYIHPVH
jgi:hypothetical protein